MAAPIFLTRPTSCSSLPQRLCWPCCHSTSSGTPCATTWIPAHGSKPGCKHFMIVGVISDTHGLFRPEAIEALRGSEHIIHAGDIGAPEIIPALEKIAPVSAIRGNVDRQPWTKKFA